MGRERKNKCFSMLTCAGVGGGGGDVAVDPANAAAGDAADCHCEEGKVLSDKSRWSFRRRSTRHRVLRNNENNNKENPNTDPINENNNNINNFSSPKYSSATEKSIVEQEKPKENNNVIEREIEEKLTENINYKSNDDNNIIIEGIKENENGIDERKEENNSAIKETEENLNLKKDLEEKELENLNLKDDLEGTELENLNLKDDFEEKQLENLNLKDDLEEKEQEINSDQFELTEKHENGNENIEPAALVIQAGFRGYMARKETIKLEKVVKIQAAVRGFIVRSQMVGTLRCFLAIIKMQSMVRSHQVKGGSNIYISNENVLLNGFASKIIDTMPKEKAIHIKCDPYKPNSTWEWLERWNYTIIQSNGPNLSIQNEIFEPSVDQSEQNRELISHMDSNSNITPVDFESQIKNPDNESVTIEVPKEETEVEIPKMEEKSISDSKFEIQTEKLESNDLSEETKLENEPIKENPNLEKPINPAFAAAQMKFQQLSSIPNSNSNSISYTFSSPKNNNTTNNENKNNHNNNYYLLKATSECGTEISISSTLDSPDRSETEGGEIVLEIQNLEMKNYQNTPTHSETLKPLEPETPNPNSESQPAESENNTSIQIEKDEKTTETPQKTITTITTELNETPSSQASVNNNTTKSKNNKTKKDKKHHNQHKKANKTGARRSLNASPISDSHQQQAGGDSEPRMSNSSSSLPSYMQATLSARAKACSGSVKTGSSPDLIINSNNNNNDNSEKKIVKRLSGGAIVNNNISVNNIKELSPRMQRSQSHESEKKGTGAQSNGSTDKRWQI
ncbi:hypothetical protein LUZ60_011748 [Juncus effusus]|nr:hypothetical protein LUZ60_011748 [Juncus effusus]